MGFVEEERFLDTLVVDSEGYICGRVESFEIQPDKVLMKLYKEVEEEREVVDVERLKEELMMALFGKVSPKNERKLYDKVKKELGLASVEQVGEEELASFARMMGLEVPMKVVKARARKTVEEPVNLDLMECMNETPLGKCIILREPWEAERRGVPILDFVPYKSTSEVKGKLVIDGEAKIVGHAEKILIGKPLGLRITIETLEEKEEIDFEALYQDLLACFKKPKKLLEKIAKDLGIRPEAVERRHVLAWAEKKGIPVPKRKKTEVVVLTKLDIPWTEIRKIGDVILLKKRIEELRAGISRRPAPSGPEPTDLAQ